MLTTFVDALKPDYLKTPRVSVEVLNYRPFYIIGEVKKPASHAYVSGMTVVNAMALAGGHTYRARENEIYVTRATDPKNVKQPADHDTHILPGDVIEVLERFFRSVRRAFGLRVIFGKVSRSLSALDRHWTVV